jgi:hypothetical protein
VILLKPNEGTRFEEARAGGTVKPGHLVMKANDGTVVVHGTAAGAAALLVATEETNTLRGKTKDDAYSSGDLLSYRPVSIGDELQMWLEDNHNVAIGDRLESAGDGTLQPVTGSFALFEATEAVDTTGGAAAAAWIKVRAVQ